MIDELKKIKIEELKDASNGTEEIEKIMACNNIFELDYTLETAIQTLESHGVPVVLREADKVIIQHEDVDFDSIDDFIAVHKDEFMPVDSIIQTPTEAGATRKVSYFFGGRTIEVESRFYRDTIHFALNGEVEEIGSEGPNWDVFPFAYLIKLKKLPIGERGYYSLGDTFTDGHVPLDEDAWILCPLGFKEEILKRNPRFKISYH